MPRNQPFSFVDPYTKDPLALDDEGNLFREEAAHRTVYKALRGCYNFVTSDLSNDCERQHYEEHYERTSVRALVSDDIRGPWFDSCIPWYNALLLSIGDLMGKRVLLVGNGRSCKEFYFVECGAHVVYTDFSFEAVLRSDAEYAAAGAIGRPRSSPSPTNGNVGACGTIQFHAVDANHLPFGDESFDVVYGSAFVHHLDDFHSFFSEVYRVLKPGGICRFCDQADSPVWGFLKRTVLRPFRIYSYWKHPRSPEDIRANVRGGFNRTNLLKHMSAHKFRKLYFERKWFFLAIGLRHIGKEVGWNKRAMRIARPIFHLLRLLDVLSTWCHRIAENRLILIWGFEK